MIHTVNTPMKNIPPRIALCLSGILTLSSSGIGIIMMRQSDEILRTAFVIR